MLLGSAYGKVGLDVSGVMSSVQNAVSALKNLKSSMELLNGGLNKLKANFDTAKAAVATAGAELDKLKAGGAAKEEIKAAADSLKKLETNASTAATAVRSAESQIQQLRQVGMQLGQGMQDLGNKLTVAVSLPLIAAGGYAIKMASDFNESKNKVEVVFGDMSKDVIAWSNTTLKAFGLGQKSAMDAVGTFGNLFTSMGLTNKESADMSKRLVELAGDLSSFNDISTTDALEKLRSGIVGETEPLRSLGVNLTEDAVKAKALAMGLSNSADNLTAAQKAQARYALILEQTKSAQGDFARTADSVANQIRTAKEEIVDLAVKFGNNLLPVTRDALIVFNGILDQLNKLGPATRQSIINWALFAIALGPVLSGLGGIIKTVITLQQIWPILIDGAKLFNGSLTTQLVPALGSTLMAVLPVIPALGLLYWAFKNNIGGITDTVKLLWGHRDYWIDTIKMISAILSPLGLLARALNALGFKEAAAGLWEFNKSMNGLNEQTQKTTDDVKKDMTDMATVTGDVAKQMEASTAEMTDAIGASMKNTTDDLEKSKKAMDAALKTTATDIKQSEANFANAGSQSGGAYTSNLVQSIQQSSAQVKMVGMHVSRLLTEGMSEDAQYGAKVAINKILKTMSKNVSTAPGSHMVFTWSGFIKPDDLEKMRQAQQIMKDGITSVSNDMKSLQANAHEAFDSNQWAQAGTNINQGLVAGFEKSRPYVVEAVRVSAAETINSFKGVMGIRSPSTVFEYMGTMSGMGYIKGLSATLNKVINIVRQIRDNTLATFRIDWTTPGRNMMLGVASGIISSISAVVAAARQSALAALAAFKAALGIHSPSKAFAVLGQMSSIGYIQGMSAAMNPAALANVIVRPMNSVQTTTSRSNQMVITNQFGGGLSVREARRLDAESADRIERRMNKIFGL